MKKLFAAVLPWLLAACASDDRVWLDAENAKGPYLTRASSEAAVAILPSLSFPMTRAGVLERLHVPVRGLPSMRTIGNRDQRPWEDFETLYLSPQMTKGRRYTLHLYYDAMARDLSGDAFATAKVITGADIVVDDDGSGQTPKGSTVIPAGKIPEGVANGAK